MTELVGHFYCAPAFQTQMRNLAEFSLGVQLGVILQQLEHKIGGFLTFNSLYN